MNKNCKLWEANRKLGILGSKHAKLAAGNCTGINLICVGRSKVHEAEDERTCQTENGED